MNVVYNAATNRQTGDVADANGNIGSGNVYDVENRMTNPGGTTMYCDYEAGNKRVFRRNYSQTISIPDYGDGQTGQWLDEFTFWMGNQKLATYLLPNGTQWIKLRETNVYFGGKLVSKGTYSAGCSCADTQPIGDLHLQQRLRS